MATLPESSMSHLEDCLLIGPVIVQQKRQRGQDALATPRLVFLMPKDSKRSVENLQKIQNIIDIFKDVHHHKAWLYSDM